jgi:zinc transport system ATP-binding protein
MLVPAIDLRGVTFAYRRGQPVLEGVDLAIEAGRFVAIAGPNGGGKTTLVRITLGLLEPTEGEAFLFGEQAATFSRRETLGYLAQRSQLGTEAPATVREVVSAGLGVRADAPLATLSGGQQQRAFIAKALAAQPGLLVLDEPTAGVDVGAQEALAELLARLHNELRVTILYISHEFGAVERFVERLVLVRGGILFDGSPGELPGTWHDPSHVHV